MRDAANQNRASKNEYLAYVVDLLRHWAPVAVRRMFSGHGLYRGDVIFALIINEMLYFKTDALNRPAYEAAGMAPFSYTRSGRPTVMRYRPTCSKVTASSPTGPSRPMKRRCASARQRRRRAGGRLLAGARAGNHDWQG
jgi:TfoX/Sxy family transcriptional regulator of competence genes